MTDGVEFHKAEMKVENMSILKKILLHISSDPHRCRSGNATHITHLCVIKSRKKANHASH